ncbi:SYCE3 protein, partial [Certhia brachydactyla]|nr:SYCE3 protein [Certhia familiaris]NXO99538.1 SYCE3 protein [Certhia brachydactyla]
MAESESQEGNYDDRGKKAENFKMGMEELLEKMEELAVHVTWMTFDNIAIQTNPDLLCVMQHLEDAYLLCKEQMEKKWQEVLME